LSATYNSALVGKEGVEAACRVEVVDSLSASMGLGLLAIVAAKAALAGADLDQVTAIVARDIPNTHYFGLVDTLEYLHKGGRIGKAQALLGSVLNVKPLIEVRDGEVYPLDKESLLDVGTGLSGSGPAYIFLIVEAMADAGVKVGLSRQEALFLSAQTVLGAAKMLIETREHPGQLRDRVTSPGGTAIAGLATLEKGGLRTTLINAVEVATNRSRELGEIMIENFANNRPANPKS